MDENGSFPNLSITLGWRLYGVACGCWRCTSAWNLFEIDCDLSFCTAVFVLNISYMTYHRYVIFTHLYDCIHLYTTQIDVMISIPILRKVHNSKINFVNRSLSSQLSHGRRDTIDTVQLPLGMPEPVIIGPLGFVNLIAIKIHVQHPRLVFVRGTPYHHRHRHHHHHDQKLLSPRPSFYSRQQHKLSSSSSPIK